MRSSLLRRVAPLVLVLAVIATACGTTANNAATANGRAISAKGLTDELKIIGCSSAYQKALEESYGGKLGGASEGTFDNTFVSQLLSIRVYYSLLQGRLDKDGVEITAADLEQARSSTDEQLDSLGKDATKCLPASYKDRLVRQQAVLAAAQSYALDHVEIACASHILVKTEAEADALKKQLDGGATFAAAAKASSIDTGSKDQGGDLGCQPKGAYVASFDKATFSLPIGKVSEPVKSEFGYHLIVVRERRAATDADLTEEVAQKAIDQHLLDVVCGPSAHVSVTPSYGTWNRSQCADGAGLARVEPRAQPKSK